MTFSFRQPTDAEMLDTQRLDDYAFAHQVVRTELAEGPLRPEFMHCAFDDERDNQMVAVSGAFPFKIRFNGQAVAAHGVTAVAVDPGYRGQGLVRRLMVDLLHRAESQDVPLAMLWASMGAIYQRFGYGLGSTEAAYRIEPRYVQFQDGADVAGQTRLVGREPGLEIAARLYRAFTADRNLLLHRNQPFWELTWPEHDPTKPKQPIYMAVHYDSAGEPEAYCIYTTKFNDADGPMMAQRLEVRDFAWRTENGYRGIWTYLAKHDLVGEIRWHRPPPDDLAPLLLLEPRALHRKTNDGIWLRVVDAEKALAARCYDLPGEVTITVASDRECPWNEDTYRVSADGAGEVDVTTTQGEADVVVTTNGLASLLSGAATASQLHRTGRISVRDAATARRLDAFFSTRYQPHCNNMF